MPASNPAARLRALGLKPRRGLSQSFLADAGVARAIVEAAHLASGLDDVLEVGPGLGILTERLVQRARRVVAVELDPDLVHALPRLVLAENLTVVHADILQFNTTEHFDQPFVVVANLPYHVTSPAVRRLLLAGPPFATRLIVMVQREVAERLVAPTGNLSAIGAWVQSQAGIEITRIVPSTAFHPRPNVDSAVLRLTPLPDEKRVIVRSEAEHFLDFLHAGFAQPRKVLGNSLAQGLKAERSETVRLLESAGIAARRRPQDLSVPEWAALFHAWTARP